MKRTVLFLLMGICHGFIMMAQEIPDTIVIENADKVVVTSDLNSLSVEVMGKKDNPDYHYSKTLEAGNDGVNVSKESNSDFDFKFPFSKSTNEYKHSFEFTVAPTLSVGLVSAMGGPSGLDTDFGKSVEITWHAFNIHYKNVNSHWRFSTGLWFNWKNYRMTGNTRFDKTDDGHVILTEYPKNADVKFSRVHTLSYQIPLIVQYTSTKFFKFAAGPLFSFNGHGNLKTRYSLDGTKYKDRDRGVHLNSFTTDIIGIVSYRNNIGAYVKYSPCNVLDTKRGPKFHAFSAGLIWDF